MLTDGLTQPEKSEPSRVRARALRRHLQEHHVEELYVEPGSPWQNGIIESFNGRLGDECLDVESFYSLEEARVVIEDYRVYYRDRRPHSALGYTTPSKYAAACLANGGVHSTGGVHPAAPSSATQERPHLAANRADTEKRAPAQKNRADGEGGEAPLPLQTSPTTPPKLISATTRTEHVVNSNRSLAVAQERQADQGDHHPSHKTRAADVCPRMRAGRHAGNVQITVRNLTNATGTRPRDPYYPDTTRGQAR